MTNTPITELGFGIAGIGYGQQAKSGKDLSLSASFQDALSQAGQSQENANVTSRVADAVSDKSDYLRAAAARANGDYRVSTSLTDAKAKADTDVKPEETGQDPKTQETSRVKDENGKTEDKDVDSAPTQEKQEQIKDTVAEKLGISKEELEEAMESLGLTVMDLTNPANLALFVQDENDIAALLMDEELLNTVQDLAAEVISLLESGEPVEPSADAEIVITDPAAEVSDAPKQTEQVLLPDEAVIVEEAPVKEAVAEEKVPVRVTVTEEETVTEEVPDASEETTPVSLRTNESGKEAGNETGADTHSQTEPDDKPAAAVPLPSDIPVAAPVYHAPQQDMTVTVPVPETGYSSNVDAADVIRQIGEYVNIHKSSELTEMEIALNPANLGNVHLRIAQDAQGNVTAVITTQNESVRDALMAQAMQLKENLESQGVKIESVEVTVASHAFEQNMNGQQQQNSTEELYEKEVAKATRRRIVVNSLSDAQEMIENGDLSDAEKVEVDMMARRGNSVNFRA